jgi:hypothetical protein
MIVRKQQVEVLERETARNYVRSFADAIREDDAEEWVYPPDGPDWIQVKDLPSTLFLDMVAAGIHRASNRGLERSDDITAFVSLMFSFAPNFDRQRTINQILTSEDVDDEERMNLIADNVSEQDWDEVEENYDESAWRGPAITHA